MRSVLLRSLTVMVRRHRRRLNFPRAAAVVLPTVSVAFVAAGSAVGSQGGIRIAAASAGVAAVVLGDLVWRVDRRGRVQLAQERAAQAADRSVEHEFLVRQHREFTAYVAQSHGAVARQLEQRIVGLEGSLAESMRTIGQLTAERVARESAEHSRELVRMADAQGDWADLWPDLSGADTVIDLMSWDERAQRSAPAKKVRRSA